MKKERGKNMEFTAAEKLLIETCYKKYEDENDQRLSKDKDGIIQAINMGHDFYQVIANPPSHKLMESILKKCGEHIETAEEKEAREEDERVLTIKRKREEMRKEIEQKHKEEMKKEMEYYNLFEAQEASMEEEPKEDLSKIEAFNNFAEVREEREKEELTNEIPPINLDNLAYNTMDELTAFAKFMGIVIPVEVTKADLIVLIEQRLGEE